jgi:hypothetical protein
MLWWLPNTYPVDFFGVGHGLVKTEAGAAALDTAESFTGVENLLDLSFFGFVLNNQFKGPL